MKKNCLTLIFAAASYLLVAQNTVTTLTKQLDWKKVKIEKQRKDVTEVWSFDGADFTKKSQTLPWCSVNFPLSQYGQLNVTLENPIYETVEINITDAESSFLSDKIIFQNEVKMSRNDFLGNTRFIPIRKINGGFEKLVRFQLRVSLVQKALPSVIAERGGPAENSALSDGTIYKLGVETTGIQRIDAKMLKDAGIDITKIDPKKIKIYGNAGGMLPESNAAARYDDVVENPCSVVGEEDGKFNDADYILFYAVGADKWAYDAARKSFTLRKNTYSNNSFYFLKIDGDAGKRIVTLPPNNTPAAYKMTSFSDFQHYEVETFNLLNEYASAPGGGRQWFGEKFTPNKKTLTLKPFTFANMDKSAPVTLKAALAYRSSQSGNYIISVENEAFTTAVNNCGYCEVDDTYADVKTTTASFFAKNEAMSVNVAVNSSGNDMEAWLDYVELNARRKLLMAGSQMSFRDIEALGKPLASIELGNANSNLTVWNVSNAVNPQKIEYAFANNSINFTTASDSTIREFIAFNPSATDLYKPQMVGKIDNQNLHGIKNPEMVIVYAKALEKEAFELALHRQNFNKMKINSVPIDQVYNEFASGAVDPVAIRDFMRFLLNKNPKFKYLLLFGDGSFNYRNIGVSAEEAAKNLIPPYETFESADPLSTFPSDDYYGLLSPDEGEGLGGSLDISVGRITASDADMAKVIVDKIINYDKNPEAMRDYRNRIIMVTDDFEVDSDDGKPNWETTFLTHSEDLSNYTDKKYKNFNVEKVHLAAFPQITTPGGQRSPDATEAINNNIFKGALFLNYIGHGGPRGWTQERIMNANTDVNTWSNYEKLPLFITATCSFAGYDSPADFTAGEQILALDKGGAVGLFSTVRAVYASDNDILTAAVFRQIYKKNNYNGRSLGDILRISKDSTFTNTENIRKFTLLGDPSQRLMIPQYDIRTTKINGKNVTATTIDTIGALQKLTIEGVVLDSLGKVLTNFNGIVYPTIYDKALSLKTIPIGTYTQDYRLQNKILFKGAATVKDGKFQFSCIIPKDINYNYGLGKISYYATDNVNDAAGSDITHLVIGGVYDGAAKDDKGPLVEVFMDNEQFVSGGTVSTNPTLVVRLADDYGINISGNSVGHDLTAILDNNTKTMYRLNDFYEATTDNFAKGKVKYPLFKISEGLHKIQVKAWDTANNPGEGGTEFLVAANGKSALEHVLNYPNPFTSKTSFQFRHHLSEINLKVQVQIYTVSGKLVKTIETTALSQGNTVDDVAWDGKDDFGSDLGKGVYIYKVKVRSVRNSNIEEEGGWEKMVILK
jgi:Peptidase family C25/FlgD Ig-like domain